MTKSELLELGITEEQADKIVEDYGKNYVSKSQFNAKNDELKNRKDEVKTLTDEIENLKQSHADNQQLIKQIDDLKAAATTRENEYAAKLKAMEVDSIVDKSIMSLNGKNTKAIRALLDLNEAKVENGEVVGLKEQLESVQKDNPYLFGTDVKPNSTLPGEPGGKTPAGITAAEFSKMNYSQRAKVYDENPELYNQLTKGDSNNE
nr:MAG TPA: minor structural protein [Caudoviricetes sp.]